MLTVAKFEKISYDQFEKDCGKFYGNSTREVYDSIQLPKRATKHSAGYDFYLHDDIVLSSNAILIPTGIKCRIDDGWVLNLLPRSSHGFKYGVHLANTVGVIDGDYYNNADNEGHIFVKLVHGYLRPEELKLSKGTAFCQGIFIPYGITVDDEVDNERIGGIGSTTQ